MENSDYSIATIQQRIASGDENALASLYDLYYERLENFAKSLVKNKETAEEIVEDVFVKLWGNRNTISEINNLNVYLYVAIKNQSLNYLSRIAKDLAVQPFGEWDIEVNDISYSPCDLLISKEMVQQVRQAVDCLPHRCKMIFKLIREDGLKYKEVSVILNISMNTIEAQMAIAIKRICLSLNIEKQPKNTPADKKRNNS